MLFFRRPTRPTCRESSELEVQYAPFSCESPLLYENIAAPCSYIRTTSSTTKIRGTALTPLQVYKILDFPYLFLCVGRRSMGWLLSHVCDCGGVVVQCRRWATAGPTLSSWELDALYTVEQYIKYNTLVLVGEYIMNDTSVSSAYYLLAVHHIYFGIYIYRKSLQDMFISH